MPEDLTGKTVVITGASAGIGAAAARELAARGATVVPVGRSADKTRAVAGELGVEPLIADFASLDQVRSLADRLLRRCPVIDVLAHNAGGVVPRREVTEDGFELTLQSNYLAPFLLQALLHERLSASRAQVIVTSSMGHRFGRISLADLNFARRRFSSLRVYGSAKLADLIFARELARRTPETGISAVAFHPGTVGSSFGRDSRGPVSLVYGTSAGRTLLLGNEQGAAPLVHLASLADPLSVNGRYFHRMRADAPTSKQSRDPALARDLWDTTEAMLGLS
ncbi:SDR family NAD(P)-dependent oxidoreductase [Saccharopolyspora sp. NFXS83]|uniref:SDR family NAD(P)-dependent oxidoreductase n=1 Tax=Saccharopolyspora sp. NFXS83 TaxID=2993560 RepID=UPI00224ADA4B|nr:SDR family NAD(P)-dependent oxidoreductase [Saccharopolyspora sp. NFXS83]MCX2730107.1 SDR family NAD(P)-dependent oxidoreductase [Saccharopolyspora sp. NFXS83]